MILHKYCTWLSLGFFTLTALGCGKDNERNTSPSSSGGGGGTGAVSGDGDGTGAMSGDGDGDSTGGTGNSGPLCEGSASQACPLAWAGVNLAGAEFGNTIPGEFNADYTYPGATDLDYFADQGMTMIRLPFRWERLQPSLNEELSSNELERLRSTVDLALERDLTVVLDPHNYARYLLNGEEQVLGAGGLTSEHFADFWTRLATEFKEDESLVLGLMNEPHDMPTSSWVDAANAAIAAIRETGAEQLILVPGNHWTGAHSWTTSDNAVALLAIADPIDNYAFEVHQYFDANYSGSSPGCVHQDGSLLVGEMTMWLKENGKQAFLGEFGAGSGDDCRVAIRSILNHLQQNSDVWLGWTYWAGGPWWGDYFTSITPDESGEDKPQMTWLLEHLP